MLLNDAMIRGRAVEGMIEPFEPELVRWVDGRPVISYGTSSYGYDARVADEFMIFHDAYSTVVDPKNFDEGSILPHRGDTCIVPPNSFVLGRTVEYFRIPRDTLVMCVGKSTYARCGIHVTLTPLEPGWEGHVTIEIANMTPLPARVYANEGICQFVFMLGADVCDVSYADRRGKYQRQRGVTLAKT
jgi:dCTP deaminase